MARVFVSHASEDRVLAGQLHRWLVEADHDVFLAPDLRDGVALGEEWERRLYEELRRADAVVALVTSTFLASQWCTAEVAIARSRGIRLLPLQAEPGVASPLLKSVQHRDITGDPLTARTALIEALRQVEGTWPDDRSPFPGLRPFEIDQQRVFFGRAEEIGQLAGLLRSPAERAEGAVLLVVGPSGCGKSSLVRAGLVPVMADEPGWRTLPPILPGADPVGALAQELAAASRESGLDWTLAYVRDQLDHGGLPELADELLLAAPGARRHRLLLVVDQFEELLTQTAPTQRARFAELLRPALTGGVQVVATLRPEFFDRLLTDPELAGLPTHTYTLRPLRHAALRSVIEKPARLAGIELDDGLADRLVEDTDSGDALPLLAFTLAQLAEGVGRGGRLSSTRYEQLGGVHGALTRQADAALADAIATGGRGREQVIAGLLRLVAVDEQGRPTRWRLRRDDLPAVVATELDTFVARRLLSTDTDNGTVVIGVAHEAFLSAWTPLAEAIFKNVAALRARRAIEHAATEWKNNGRPRIRLWGGGQLAAALTDTDARIRVDTAPRLGQRNSARWLPRRTHMLITDRVNLSPAARDFLHTSIRRDRYQRRRLTTGLSVLLVGALIAAGIAVFQERIAEQGQRIATARQLIAQAEAALDADPQTALQLGVAARHIHRDAETHSILISLLTRTQYAGTFVDSDRFVESTVVSPDGQILVTSSGVYNSTVNLWDFTDRSQPRRIGQPLTDQSGVTSLAFSPDSRILAIGSSGDINSSSGVVTLWDIDDPAHPLRIGGPLTGQGGPVSSVAFSPNGEILAAGSYDSAGSKFGDKALLWDLTDRSRPRLLGEPLTGMSVFSVAFSPDGHILVTEGEEVILWDVVNPALPRRVGQLPAGPGASSVAFSPVGHILAIGGGGVILWDITDPALPRRIGQPITSQDAEERSVEIFDGADEGRSMAFSSDGNTLAVGSDNGTTTLWDLSTPAAPRRIGPPLTGHTGWVKFVSFFPDGRTLVTGSDDGSMLWDLADRIGPTPVGPRLRGPVGPWDPIEFSPDGRMLATGSGDGTVTLWDLVNPAHLRRIGQLLTGHDDALASLAFSPRGRTLATGSINGITTLWDLTDPSQPRRIGQPLTNQGAQGASVTFSSDGRILATSDNNSLILWDITEPARPKHLWQSPDSDSGPGLPVAFSPGGHTLATGGGGSAILWDIADPTRPRRLGAPLDDNSHFPAFSVEFSPDGRVLATGNHDGSVMLWDIGDPAQPQRIGQPLTRHEGPNAAVAFSPDGRTFATNTEDGTVIMWDLTDLPRPRRLGQPLGFGHMAFAPDGRTLATGGFSILWDLTGLNDLRDRATERACVITRSGLDRDQWARYIPDLPYQATCPT